MQSSSVQSPENASKIFNLEWKDIQDYIKKDPTPSLINSELNENKNDKKSKKIQNHALHMVGPSGWPFSSSFILLALTSSFAFYMHSYENMAYIVIISLVLLIWTMALWFKDITTESTYLGFHTLVVQKGIALAFNLFIISEIFFFLAIFWTYFHSALAPTVELGVAWPPLGIQPINPFELPLLNTIILLSSAMSLTYAHHCLIKNDREGSLNGLVLTLLLAILFTYFQNLEYSVSGFTISDGIYGSCFFFATGFHGFHVIIGTAFLSVGLGRSYSYHFSGNHHLGLESGILYWHFVDVVWIFLYIAIYYWGS